MLTLVNNSRPLRPHFVISPFLSLLLFCKNLYCFHLIPDLRAGLGLIKKLPSGFREGSGRSPDTREMQRGPSKAAGVLRLSVKLQGEPVKKMLTQCPVGVSQPATTQVVAHLDEFHLLIKEVALQEGTEMGVCGVRTQAMQIPKDLVQAL